MQKSQIVAVSFNNGVTGLFPLTVIAFALLGVLDKSQVAEIPTITSDAPLNFGNLSIDKGIGSSEGSSNIMIRDLDLLNTMAGVGQGETSKYSLVTFADGSYGYFAQEDIPGVWGNDSSIQGKKNISLKSDINFAIGNLSVATTSAYQGSQHTKGVHTQVGQHKSPRVVPQVYGGAPVAA